MKRGIGRHRVLSRTPQDACALIRAAAKAAVARIPRLAPLDIGRPVEIEIRFSRASDADVAAGAGGERIDGLTVRWQRPTIADHFGGLWQQQA